MSIQAVGWVLKHADAQGADRAVLVAIANYAKENDDGDHEAWPGNELIAEEAGLDAIKTVKAAIARLVKTGQITRKINGAPDTRLQRNLRTNLYIIHTRPRTLAEQLGQGLDDRAPRRFTRADVARHPVLGAGNPKAITFPGGEQLARGRRVSPQRPPAPQVWIVRGQLYLRITTTGPDGPVDELVPLDPTRGGPSDSPPPAAVENLETGGSWDGPPHREGGRPTVARGVVSGSRGGSSDGREGGRGTTPKPKEEPKQEPSLNRDDDDSFSARDLTSPVDNPTADASAAQDARLRLAELLNRRADRPSATTGLRTGREAFDAARTAAWETRRDG